MYKYFPNNHFLSRAINLSLLSISISSEMKDLNFNVETNVFDTLKVCYVMVLKFGDAIKAKM